MMGFDLIGKNRDDQAETDKPPFQVSIVISGRHYNNLDDYLDDLGLSRNTVRFSCSNRYWHTIWGFVQYLHRNGYSSKCTQRDFEKGSSNDGHPVSAGLAGSIAACCEKGLAEGWFDRYMAEELIDEPDRCLDMVERFINFCGKSGGFYIF